MKHYTILELGTDTESPMIGTIDNVTNNPQGRDSFRERLFTAVGEHFDITNEGLIIPPVELGTGSSYDDYIIEVDGVDFGIRVMETWVY